jgi:hypothetical protein
MVELLGYILKMVGVARSTENRPKNWLNKLSKQEFLVQEIPVRRYTQRLEEKYPNHIDHLDQTTEDRTWALHEELLGCGQSYVCYQVSRWMVIIHRASKIFLIQPMKRVNSCISILLDDEVNKMT